MNTNDFYYKNNRLQQLRGFCYTAQFGSITRAAHHMGLTHSSVSLQIKSLESDFGVRLFDRVGPKVTLTNEGKTLLDLALPHIDGIQNLYDTFHHETSHQKKTEISIAANSTTLNFILPKIIKRFLKEYPHIYINIHYAEHEEATQKILSGEVDFALLPRREHKQFSPDLLYIPTFYYTPSLITRANHPLAGRTNLTVREICNYELSLPDEDLRVIADLYDIFSKNEIKKKLRINFINWETTRKYIEEGLVISISSDVIIGDNDSLVATPLSHLFPTVDYGFVHKNHVKIPKKVRDFIDISKRNH